MSRKLHDRRIGDFDAMTEMQIVEIFSQGDERLDSSIGEGYTFIEDEVADTRGVSDDCCEVRVLKTGALRQIEDAEGCPFLRGKLRDECFCVERHAAAEPEFAENRKCFHWCETLYRLSSS
jgi:hypothetical protein